MMTETAKPSLLLPSGATISVIAAVLEGFGEAGPAAQALAYGAGYIQPVRRCGGGLAGYGWGHRPLDRGQRRRR